jgi:hypothetical protein
LPLVGGKLFTYAAGTTTPIATYTDHTGSSLNTNPIILDSAGQANVWLTDTTTYKYTLTTPTNVPLFTVDYVSVPLTTNSFASPPAIGSSVPNEGTFTNLNVVDLMTLEGTGAAIINVGTTGERPATVTQNYTIPADKNAGTFGPISVADSITVTVPSTSVWSIV